MATTITKSSEERTTTYTYHVGSFGKQTAHFDRKSKTYTTLESLGVTIRDNGLDNQFYAIVKGVYVTCQRSSNGGIQMFQKPRSTKKYDADSAEYMSDKWEKDFHRAVKYLRKALNFDTRKWADVKAWASEEKTITITSRKH